MRLRQQGVFRYRTRAGRTGTGEQAPVRTLTAADSIVELDADTAIDGVRNIIAVPWTPVVMDTEAQIRTWVWETRNRHRIPAGGSLDVWAAPDRPLADLDIEGSAVTERPTFPNTYATLSRTPDGGQLVFDNVKITVSYWDVGTIKLTIANNNTFPVWTANTANFPAIGVAGVASRIDRPIAVRTRDDDSVDRFGPQPYDAPANQWIQRRHTATNLADALLADLATPSLVVTGLTIMGDPRLQLGDLVRLVDPDGIALDGDYRLTAIRDEITSDGGYRQRIAARRAS